MSNTHKIILSRVPVVNLLWDLIDTTPKFSSVSSILSTLALVGTLTLSISFTVTMILHHADYMNAATKFDNPDSPYESCR